MLPAALRAQTRMMPLGNSITEGTGSSHDSGYRRDLYALLQNAGVAFDFVGGLRYGSGFPDLDHEGHPGFLADQLNVSTYLANHPAHVVFLEIGTNNISYGESALQVRDAIQRVIENIFLTNRDLAVYLCTVLPRKDDPTLQAATAALNALLPEVVYTQAAAGYKIYLVDVAARFLADPAWKTNLLADNLHPNDAGYTLMANALFDAYQLHSQPRDEIFADDFNAGALDENKWQRGNNSGNLSGVAGNALALKSNGVESGWIISRQAYPIRNMAITCRIVQPNGDGNLGISPTYDLAAAYGIHDQPNWYRFYVYRGGSSGPYRLFVAWKKNGVEDGVDVTGNRAITGAIYLRLRSDDSMIYFESSFDGAAWETAYSEPFALAGYTVDSNFHYEFSAYYTSAKGSLVVDDFALTRVKTGADTQPPQLSAIAAQNITPTGAQISWQTNEPADAQVEYGVTSNYGAASPLASILTATHAETLAALLPNTTYHFRVKSKDGAGNLAVSGDFSFTTAASANALFADAFNAGSLDNNKWLKGANAANHTAVANAALDLKASGTESGWVITRQAWAARQTAAAVKLSRPNDDGNLGISPTYNLSAKYGLYDQPNWYRFYTYRSSHTGPYRLYAEWKKNGVNDGLDVTGHLVINGAIYLRLRFDHSKIHFEASFDGVQWTDTYSETFNLPGYTLDSPFYYELSSYNSGANGILTADDFAINRIETAPDVQPPVISQVVAQNITTSGAQISWQTDEDSDAQVEYGLTASYGNIITTAAPLTTAHRFDLANLPANTLFHYRVKSTDAAGNLALGNDFTFTTLAPATATTLFADDFTGSSLNGAKWLKGTNAGNKSAIKNHALELRSQNGESGWVVTKNAYAAQHTLVTVKIAKPSNDGSLGMSPTFNAAARFGIDDQNQWYRFYLYRSGNTGPYRLYAGWKKNGVKDSRDVTGSFVITGAVYLRLRFDASKIYFDASLDGSNWTETYAEIFDLPGYTLATPYYYELAAYKTGIYGVRTVDDFSIVGNAARASLAKGDHREAAAENLPATFALQNYPNPFNAATFLQFSLPQTAEISLTVFDLQGREVRELASGTRTAGRYEVVWEGRGRAGEDWGAGVYFVRWRYRPAGASQWTQVVRRVMLVK